MNNYALNGVLEKKWRMLGETLKRRGADEKSQDEIFKTPTALACNSFFFPFLLFFIISTLEFFFASFHL